jgi:predicted nucleic-acid-binding Zn-ribbon protein
LTSNTCPKCSSNMVRHPSLLSMPLCSSQEITATDTKKVNIEDQDANFIFRFSSCSKCGYSEFYLTNSSGSRI